MTSILISALKIIFLLGFLIGIHETGHFLVAKLCKVRVNEFAIGFGPSIWKKQGVETKYAIRLIPLGGYVSMEGEGEHSDKEGSFTKAKVSKRIAIVMAGAVVNIIFALVVYFVLSINSGDHISTVIDSTIPNYAAETAGIQAGDKILKVNNKNVYSSNDVNSIMENNNGEDINITLERNNEKQNLTLKPTEVKFKSTGIYLYQTSQHSTKIAGIVGKSPAESAGLKTGDNIISVNGAIVKDDPESLINIMNTDNYNSLKFEVDRSGKTITINVTPQDSSVYYIGVQFKEADKNISNDLYYALLDTGNFMTSIGSNLKQLFMGKVSTDQLMGPVGISEVVAKTNGFKEFVYMLALISMSLGITNLLPFPPLDGGKILLLIIEGIRRKPIKEGLEVQIQMFGFAILIVLSVYVTYHDILRLF